MTHFEEIKRQKEKQEATIHLSAEETIKELQKTTFYRLLILVLFFGILLARVLYNFGYI